MIFIVSERTGNTKTAGRYIKANDATAAKTLATKGRKDGQSVLVVADHKGKVIATKSGTKWKDA